MPETNSAGGRLEKEAAAPLCATAKPVSESASQARRVASASERFQRFRSASMNRISRKVAELGLRARHWGSSRPVIERACVSPGSFTASAMPSRWAARLTASGR